MKKTILVLLMAVAFTGLWAQAPETVGTDYERVAAHYTDGETHFVNSDVFFKLNSIDGETGLDYIQFSLDGSDFMLYRNPFQVLTEGKHDLSYRGYDNSANLEIAKTFSFIVDNTAPRAVLETDKPVFVKGYTRYCSAETKWFVTSKDNVLGSGVAATYLGTDFNELYQYPVKAEAEEDYFVMTEEGEYDVYYSAIDNVGNLAPIALYTVIVDTTPPEVSIQNNNRLINVNDVYTFFPSENLVDEEGRILVSTNEAVAFSATDNLSGVDAIYIKINDGSYTKYVEPIKFSVEDVYNLEVQAVDNVGNVSEPVSFVFLVDKYNPASALELVDRYGNEILNVEEDGTLELQ